jgi:hypothetical protein
VTEEDRGHHLDRLTSFKYSTRHLLSELPSDIPTKLFGNRCSPRRPERGPSPRRSSVRDLISALKGGTYLEPARVTVAAHTQSSWQELSDAYGVDLGIPPDYARAHYGLVDVRRDLDLKRGDSDWEDLREDLE